MKQNQSAFRSDTLQNLQSIIGNRAMLSLSGSDNSKVIQMHSYTEEQLSAQVDHLFKNNLITEAQYYSYIEKIYSEAGMDDSDVLTIGLVLNIRTQCYPQSFNANVITWKNHQITHDQFYCPDCQNTLNKNMATIDHINPVSHHWNTIGYNTNRETRFTFYNDITNLRLLCRSCNSAKGGEHYSVLPGPDYSN